jgi:glycine reductase
VTAVTPVAKMVGANRVVQGRGIVYPLGDADLTPDEEKDLRRRIVLQALETLKNEAAGKS